jgi:ferredoxin
VTDGTEAHPPIVVDRDGLDALLRRLGEQGRRVLGPTARDGAIVIDDLDGVDDLPAGWGDDQAPGHYRLLRRTDDALFGHVVGPHPWKSHLFPPRTRLFRASRSGAGAGSGTEAGFAIEAGEDEPPPPTAFVGVRPCDLRAIDVQTHVFESAEHSDPAYHDRRTAAVTVAVQCTDPAATCFCTSMGSGPRAEDGFDLALTELLDGGHRFVVEIGSPAGAELTAGLPGRPATGADLAAAQARTEAAATAISRRVDTADLPARLAASLSHPRWDDVAQRCLTCANCTMVCPTCFCSTVEDTTDLTGEHAERWRRWDSCFTLGHSYLHGGPVRSSGSSRYRQWLTHKFGTWWDQFGESGCVGCGRCLTWCPVGIDVTEELAALAAPAPAPETAVTLQPPHGQPEQRQPAHDQPPHDQPERGQPERGQGRATGDDEGSPP